MTSSRAVRHAWNSTRVAHFIAPPLYAISTASPELAKRESKRSLLFVFCSLDFNGEQKECRCKETRSLLQIGLMVQLRQEFILSDFIVNTRCYDVT
jgi:hypothetical protein